MRMAGRLARPGPHPQERGSRSLRLAYSHAPDCSLFFSTNGLAAAMTPVASEFSRDANRCSLPGERAGVRASVFQTASLCFLCLLLFNSVSSFAHEVRPAYLELRQTGPETYDVLWKVPGQGENLRFGLHVEL